MVTSVGHDTRTSCASIRAAITRWSVIPSTSVLGEDSGEEEPVLGSAVALLTTGYVLAGRWLRLALDALTQCAQELERERNVDAMFWQRVGLIVALPELIHARFDSDEECEENDVGRALIPALSNSFARPIRTENMTVMCRGHAGVAIACREGRAWMEQRRVDRVIVVGVDSYLDPHSISWLDENDRLRTESNPAGVPPGEAGAAFMLEPGDSRDSIAGRARALLLGVAVARESRSWASGELSYGEGLAAAASPLLVAAETPAIISDANGETWRSHELGGARVRMRDRLTDALDVILPAESIGDVGAASAAIAIGICAESFARRYAKAERVLILCSSDGGDVGALLVGKP